MAAQQVSSGAGLSLVALPLERVIRVDADWVCASCSGSNGMSTVAEGM